MTIEDLEELADKYLVTITANTPDLRAITKYKKWGVSLGNRDGSFYQWDDTLEGAVTKAKRGASPDAGPKS